jgi:hypothetical protein
MFTTIRQCRPGPRQPRAVLIGLCLILLLNLAQAAAGPTAPGDTAGATNAAALRAQVAAAGWATVRVDLRAPPPAAGVANAAAADDLEQTTQDLLFTLPAGSYDTVKRTTGSASLTLRVDAAGLDALLGSPWAASVAAGDTPEMQRLAGGDLHSLAIKTNGSLYAWGFNNLGQIGDGTRTNRSTPVQVLTGVAAVAASSQYTLAIKTDGSLWAWGYNGMGQLGNGTYTNRSTPVQVLSGVAAVSAGWYHALALKTDGSLWTWGFNEFGQLGDGTHTIRSTPVQILTGVAAVAAGGAHTLAIKTDGSLWAWGDNAFGLLGDGTTTSRLTPVQVLTEVAAVSASSWHTLALKTDGNLWAWGTNFHGHLGDGTTTDRLTPVQVLTGVAAASAGGIHTLARKTDGSLWAWGYNGFGELGDGTTTNRPSPVPVPGFGGSSVSDADFTVTNVTLNPSAPLAGGTFNASITVKNRGTQAGNPGTLRVWANQRETQDCAAQGGADISLANLPAGAKQTVRINLPAGTAGYKTLRTFIDSQCQTAEPDEANNQATKGYRVFAQPIADFAVTAIDLTPNRPAANGTFSAAVTVKNRGTAAGDAGTLALWVDQAGVPACGFAGDAALPVGTLAAGASRTLTLDGLPAGTAAAKSLRAFIDSTCVSAEAYDDNNQRVKPYTVVP